MVLLALCAALAVSLMANYLSWRTNRDQLLSILAETGIADFNETAVREISRELTPHHAQILAARALVHEVMSVDVDSEGQPVLSPEARAKGLEEARELARHALRSQPNSWQAAMFLGASRYLEWSLKQDRRLFESAAAWEEPLRRAVDVTGGKAEPRRMLAAAYLETWWALAPSKQQEAKELLREAFANDSRSFTSLSPRWLQVARRPGIKGLQDAFEIIPDQPNAWVHLETYYRDLHDWPAFVSAHREGLDALDASFNRDLEEARERLRLGDFEKSRTLCLDVLRRAPRQLRFVPRVVEALEIYPPGLRGLSSNSQLQKWLRWSLELDGIGIGTLTSNTAKRIADAAGDLSPPDEAHVALMSKDALGLGLFERRAQPELQWRRFLLRRAQSLIEQEELQQAMERLRKIDRLAALDAPYWLVQKQLAKAKRASAALSPEIRAEAEEELKRAEKELIQVSHQEWNALAWQGSNRASTLQLFPSQEAPGLSLTIAKAPPEGAVIDILWNGALVATKPVVAGQALQLTFPIEQRLYLLEIRSLTRSTVVPGPVQLRL